MNIEYIYDGERKTLPFSGDEAELIALKETGYLTDTPSVRRYPRSCMEAFGPDATQACAIEHHRCTTTRYALWVALVITLMSILGIIWSLT